MLNANIFVYLKEKSIPIVDGKLDTNSFLAYRNSKLVLPTPLSPTITTKTKKFVRIEKKSFLFDLNRLYKVTPKQVIVCSVLWCCHF